MHLYLQFEILCEVGLNLKHRTFLTITPIRVQNEYYRYIGSLILKA